MAQGTNNPAYHAKSVFVIFFLESKKECKDQESIQSSTTHGVGYHGKMTNESQEVDPFPAVYDKESTNIRA